MQTDYLAGKTVYFLLRNATGSIWNGAAFEAYVTANYTTYDIAGVEQGTASGYYVGTMPAASAGVYYSVAKEQIGGAPAETDITVGTGSIQWDGTSVLSLSGVPTATQITAIAAGVLAGTIETGRTLVEALRLILAAAAGKISGAVSGSASTVVVRDTNDTLDRISATCDANGNRTAVTLNDS